MLKKKWLLIQKRYNLAYRNPSDLSKFNSMNNNLSSSYTIKRKLTDILVHSVGKTGVYFAYELHLNLKRMWILKDVTGVSFVSLKKKKTLDNKLSFFSFTEFFC